MADSFNPNADAPVEAIALQADGKILVGGTFTNIGGQPRNRIARLDPATGLADSFNPNANGLVDVIVVQADGKILVGGDFNGTNSIGGQTRNRIARLDATTGLADSSFDPNANALVLSIAVQADAKILVGGYFNGANSIGGQMRNRIARLDSTTGLADSFDPNVTNGRVESIAVQGDGKILVGGGFFGANSIGGQMRNHIARLAEQPSQSLSFTAPQIWLPGTTITLTTNLTFSGYNSVGLSYWLEVPTAIAPFLTISGVTYSTTFPDPTQTTPNPAPFNGDAGFGARPGYELELRDLGSTINDFGNVPGPGTYQINTIQITIAAGAPPGTYTLFSTINSPRISAVTSFDGTNFEDNDIVPSGSFTFSTAATAPAITSMNNTTFSVDSNGSFNVTTTGVPTPTLSENGALPGGVTFDTATGVLSGTPAAGTGGVYPITFTASNGVPPDAMQSFTLTVNQAPAITSANNTTFMVGSNGSFTVTRSGFPTPTLSRSGALPSGVTFNTSTGVLSGTPAAGTGGVYPITFTASNGVLPNEMQSFTLRVNQAPALTSANNTTFVVGSNSSFTVTRTGFPTPTLSKSGALPSGVTFSTATGVLSGTPAAGSAGVYPITFTASNGVSPNAMQNFTLTASTVAQPPVITSSTAMTTAGQRFVYQIVATQMPTSYSASGFPSGFLFNNTTGVLSGVPAQAGTYQIALHASNPIGTGNATLTLTVNPAPSSGPIITSGTSETGRTGTPFNFQILASRTTAAARVSAIGLPPGLTIDAASGLISGTPTLDGGFRVTITVTDGSKSTTRTLQLTFTSDPGFPIITSPKTAALAPGAPFTYKITAPAVTIPSDHTTFSFIGTLPAGLTFNPATGIISGVITAKAFREFHAAREHAGPGDVVTSKPLNDTPIIGSIDLLAHNSHGTGLQTLNLVPPASNPVLNISSRLRVQTGENVLIGGFIVIGSDSKKVLVRGIGPSLTGQGVSGALADPVLELRDSASRLIKSNDNWKSSQRAEIEATGAAPTKDLESAIVTTLAPGRYTAILQGKNATTGIGSVEIYDLSASITSKLANISTRAFVSTGDNVMIGGFIIGPSGTGQTKVIIRAIGPSLSGAGIMGIPLQDPVLELHKGTPLIAQNDNWRDTQQAEIQATGIPPTDIRESAIVKTLTPGAYTAIVRGKNGSTGVAVIELYVLEH